MKITSESAILGIGLIILAYEIFVLKSRDEEIIAVCKTDYKVLHTEIDTLRGASTAATTSRNLENSPFTCDGTKCTSEDKLFLFPKGVIIGTEMEDCDYGDGILSVDASGSNCPSGLGSVTFGRRNVVTGDSGSVTGGETNTAGGEFASISGGFNNHAKSFRSSISGGLNNRVSGDGGSVTGGDRNTASGKYSSVSGGYSNTAKGKKSSISGGSKNEATGTKSSILGGEKNKISRNMETTEIFTCEDDWCTSKEKYFLFSKGIVIGQKSSVCNYGDAILSVDRFGDNCPSALNSVTFGKGNNATDDYASVTGGQNNTAMGESSSVSGGKHNIARGKQSSILGGYQNIIEEVNNIFPQEPLPPVNPTNPFSCVDGWCTSLDHHFIFPKGIVIGYKKPQCGYGNGILSVDSGRMKDGEMLGSNCASGSGAVTFGRKNTASGISSSVLGGIDNEAGENELSILGNQGI